jgi:hypothetical protein
MPGRAGTAVTTSPVNTMDFQQARKRGTSQGNFQRRLYLIPMLPKHLYRRFDAMVLIVCKNK